MDKTIGESIEQRTMLVDTVFFYETAIYEKILARLQKLFVKMISQIKILNILINLLDIVIVF